MGRGLRAGAFATALFAAGLSAGLHAQTGAPLPPSTDPADRLAANLVVLAQNPRDVRALTEAGLSAIAVGDGNAALSFLAKAEQIAPTDGRIKAGLASALLLLEKPADAIKLFDEAADLGVPEARIAGDRGLAYDLRGESRRAQRDYATALRAGADDEITRRYALSLGISGDRDRAFELLDPLLRRQDLAAWRARAFVLAMTGDVSAAEGLAQRIMPGGSGASMSPFLRRLAVLDPARRALAVNLGIMPSDGTRLALASPSPIPVGGGIGGGLVPAGPPLGPRAEDQPARRADPVSREPRRRPGRETVTFTPAKPTAPSGTRAKAAAAKPAPILAEAPRVLPTPGFTPEAPRAVSNPAAPVLPANSAAGALNVAMPAPAASAATVGPPAPTGGIEVAAVTVQPAPLVAATAASPAVASFNLASIVATLEREPESAAGPLPDAQAVRAAKAAAQRKAAAAAKAESDARAAKAKEDAEAQAAKKNPARIWVQVATGANDAGLPLTWKRLREKAPAALKGLSASSTAYRATNRLLVGPFKSAAEAKKTVSALSKAGVSTFVFTSEPGQEIAKVATR